MPACATVSALWGKSSSQGNPRGRQKNAKCTLSLPSSRPALPRPSQAARCGTTAPAAYAARQPGSRGDKRLVGKPPRLRATLHRPSLRFAVPSNACEGSPEPGTAFTTHPLSYILFFTPQSLACFTCGLSEYPVPSLHAQGGAFGKYAFAAAVVPAAHGHMQCTAGSYARYA